MLTRWAHEEIEYLESKWGEISIPTIAKKLGRTVNAIKIKAQKLGLGRHLHSGEEITFIQLLTALGKRGNYSYCKQSWSEHGCPVKYKKSIHKRYMVIRISGFWKWAEQNKQLLDFSNFELNALGKEPAWVAVKRRVDIAAQKYKTTPWTKTEDKHLISLLNEFKYGYREISDKLCRTEGAIKRRMIDLGLKQRPVRMPNHNPWESHNIEVVKTMYFQGCTPEIIAGKVGRSACAVRGLIERLAARNELTPPPPVKETRKKIKAGTHYSEALPAEQWPKARRFLQLMSIAQSHAVTTGMIPDLDLRKLQSTFAGIEGGTAI